MIVAFGRRKRVGKDTAAKFLCNYLRTGPKLDCIVVGFTDPIKAICHFLYGWGGVEPGIYYENKPELKDVVLQHLGKSPRQLWIDVGNALTTVRATTWSDMVINHKTKIVIVKDLRRPIEANAIKEVGGWNIDILNDRIPASNDAIDHELDDYRFDELIGNHGALDELHAKICKLGERLAAHVRT